MAAHRVLFHNFCRVIEDNLSYLPSNFGVCHSSTVVDTFTKVTLQGNVTVPRFSFPLILWVMPSLTGTITFICIILDCLPFRISYPLQMLSKYQHTWFQFVRLWCLVIYLLQSRPWLPSFLLSGGALLKIRCEEISQQPLYALPSNVLCLNRNVCWLSQWLVVSSVTKGWCLAKKCMAQLINAGIYILSLCPFLKA